YALVRSRRGRLEELAEEGARGARLALSHLKQIGDYISACQVGITMASIGIGALGEPAIAHTLEPIFGKGGGGDLAVAVCVVIAYLLITFFQSTVGEIVPKLYTIQHAEGLARRIAPAMQTFIVVFRPLIVALNASSEWMLRRFGVDPDAEPAHGTPEELKRLIAESQTGGHLDVGEAEMLTGVFHLHEQEARQVMTPIPAVVTVDIAESVGAALRRAVATGHSRLVVIEHEDEDEVRGIVHVNQLTKLLLELGEEADFATLVREAPIFPETKPLDDLLADLQRERTELGIVVDEYGRTAGIVTIEDIIEEVVGEIADETDPAGGAVRRLANGDWFVRGHVAVSDLEDYGLELPVDTDAYNSVGGFVFAQLGRLPKRGDTIRANGYSIRVESVRQNRIEAVRIRERHEP
ncbi:MAG: HlyC/CorC family transporter, partial [Acidobacteriota bacterium]|nr:HlyC/CorC family transporter [Acidobacteriota bacterium]